MNQRIASRLVDLAIARGLSAYAVETRPESVGGSDSWIVNINHWPEDSMRFEITGSTLVETLHWLDLPEIEQ